MIRPRAWLVAATAALALVAAPASAGSAHLVDTQAYARARYGAAWRWYADNTPVFEASDAQLSAVYAYRWRLFKAHLRDLGARGYIVTEFLDDVGWQREPYASLNDATAFHIYEGRWLSDRRYIGDYVDYMTAGGGNDRHFSEGIADAIWARYLADGDRAAAVKHLDSLEHVYGLWDDHFDFSKGLYWIEPLLDATEYTIASIDASGGKDGFTGGEAFRPSINSLMYADARAISQMAALAGDGAASAAYADRAQALKAAVLASLWSPEFGHFIDRYKVDNAFVHYGEPIRGRELVGYLPWYAGMVGAEPAYAGAWRHLLSPSELGGPFGLRTVEPSYPNYMRQYRYDAATGGRECQWNGPAWPFQTTEALVGLARLLHAGGGQGVIGRADYMRLLEQYARLHGPADRLDLQEDYDPDTGRVIVGLPRSHHYNHSGFNDLVITGLAGLEPRADDVLSVDPLVPVDPTAPGHLRWFALEDVPYHGRRVSILWDEDGQRFHRGAGLRLFVDGAEAASAPTLRRLAVPMPRRAPPAPSGPIDVAVELVRGDFPKPLASVNATPAALHGAVDGRVWGFPEIPNGWTSRGAPPGPVWFAVDFGRPLRLSGAEVDVSGGDGFAPPRALRLQAWTQGAWRDLPARGPAAPEGDAPNRYAWSAVQASRLRLLLEPDPRAPVRLVELKAF